MKRAAKRKMHQKRRKKEKAEQRKHVIHSIEPATTSCSGLNFKINKGNQCKLDSSCNKQQQQKVSFGTITSYSQGLQLWWQTYCSALEFHSKQQNSWHANDEGNKLKLLEQYANEYETSSEEEEESNVYQKFNNDKTNFSDKNNIKETVEELVDEEYIQFLEITRKHQEDLRLKRIEENCLM